MTFDDAVAVLREMGLIIQCIGQKVIIEPMTHVVDRHELHRLALAIETISQSKECSKGCWAQTCDEHKLFAHTKGCPNEEPTDD